jgi:metal-responsive CopG/Arc/MetJ family transcriptional regulator
MRIIKGISLDPDVVRAVDKMAAEMGWSRSRTVNYILRQGVVESSNVMAGLESLKLSDVLEYLASAGAKKKVRK